MPIVIGVSIRRTKDKIYCDAGNFDLKLGERVIVQTENGLEVGIISEPEKFFEKGDKNLTIIGKTIRQLTSADEQRLKENEIKAHEVWKTISQKIEDYELKMKLTALDYTFDRSKLFIYYTAEERVDFRELIKDLGHLLKTRIQMVQIGVREETRLLGGLGPCGRTVCCSIFLKDFQPVTVELAKEQNLPLNIAKLTGLCGKLVCCLAYEHPFYQERRKHFPQVETIIKTDEGEAKVKEVNYLTGSITVEFSDGRIKKVNIRELKS
jgi:cell fate regulator YaaT (PSP1 superfamily)